ncbi:glycine cleavage system H protein [Patellaria atrata CBS 101060]|uniref:Glycine cleavage system H protein n=1 Tax=Patellaria atrata CBS 101060 TaxID=1346257 RepID=A0A9P4VMP1_9PEZI|nr:glycine cleavage system H protein [Patellaria atrata CBS 101060]
MAARTSIARCVCQLNGAVKPCIARPARVQSISSWQLSVRYQATRSFSISSRAFKKKYTEDHEWFELSEDGKTGTVGISEYASNQLGDVVYVELPEVGLEVEKGGAIGTIESVKSANDLYSPVSGKIIEANSTLEDKPGSINVDPEGNAWIAKIELASDGKAELEGLMTKEKYKEFAGEH